MKESKLNTGTLLAILLVDVAPVDSVDFPRRTHYFCKQGPEMDEALNSATELDVRELFKQPQFGELQHSFEAHSAFPTPTSSHPEDKRVGKTRTTRSSPLPGFTTPVAPAGKSHNDRSGYNIDSLSSDSDTEFDSAKPDFSSDGTGYQDGLDSVPLSEFGFDCVTCNSRFLTQKGLNIHIWDAAPTHATQWEVASIAGEEIKDP